MRSHIARRLVYAGVTSLVAAGAATVAATAAVAAPDLTAGPARVAAGPAGGAGQVLLITGMRFGLVSGAGGRPVLTMLPAKSGSAMPITRLSVGGRTLEVPFDAQAYLGHGLDASLFDVTVLRRVEGGGRLPVQVSYQGQVPVLPGIRITSAAGGMARGYLTAASALKFGAALRRQFFADHARASYGTDGLFAGGVSIAVAGAAAPRPVRPQFQMHTLTVKGINLAGKPDNGDFIDVFNVDDLARFGDPIETETVFEKGVAKFSVPTGHYFVVGQFLTGSGTNALMIHEVVLPQISVLNDKAKVTVDERAATSELQVMTPRPAIPFAVSTLIVRTPGRPGGEPTAIGEDLVPGWSLWVNPTHQKPTVGGLRTFTQFQLVSRVSRPGVPYAYNLDFEGPQGLIPSQRFMARKSSLAVVDNRYFQDFSSVGGFLFNGGTREEFGLNGFIIEGSVPLRLPGQLIEYVTASPDVAWSQTYFQFVDATPGFPVAAGGQSEAFRSFRPGQHVTDDWNDYPLHPEGAVSRVGFPGGVFFGPLPAAGRVGNVLTLLPTAFSDNTAGHLGAGFLDGTGFQTTSTPSVSVRFRVEQDGKTLASGKLGKSVPQVKLSNHPSTVRYTLTARRTDPHYDLSTATDTTWTWRSRPDSTAKVPAPWGCVPLVANFNGNFVRQCAVQPMMTLRYQIAGLGLNGATAPGKQTIRLSVGHLQLAADPAIARAAMRVSFNGGRTWHAAKVTRAGKGGQFNVVFSAPAKAFVTLRVTAADKAGGSVLETITSAYKTS